MAELIFLIILFAGAGSVSYMGHRTKRHRYYTARCRPPAIEATDFITTSEQLGLTPWEIHNILDQNFPYYIQLEERLQRKFRFRLAQFMFGKTFIIKDNKGAKEMPVLVSAAAVQLTFGLRFYRLPFYKYIRIYPGEYFSEHEVFKILAGNVQDNVISIAWNHVLDGNANPADGRNTTLHEMSHALYIQKLVIDKEFSKKFNARFRSLISECKKAYRYEAAGQKDLYSDYAQTNPQEFWAESVELFFERSRDLTEHYPDVYEAMVLLLNQEPANAHRPVTRMRKKRLGARYHPGEHHVSK